MKLPSRRERFWLNQLLDKFEGLHIKTSFRFWRIFYGPEACPDPGWMRDRKRETKVWNELQKPVVQRVLESPLPLPVPGREERIVEAKSGGNANLHRTRSSDEIWAGRVGPVRRYVQIKKFYVRNRITTNFSLVFYTMIT